VIPFDSRHIGSASIVALSRHGGVSADPFGTLNVARYVGDNPDDVDTNIERVRVALQADGVAVMSAEHGRTVLRIIDAGQAPPADGLTTNVRGLALLALSADCVPVALVDVKSNNIGVFHAGWKGVLANVAGAAVDQLVDYGSQPGNIYAVIGPAICAVCYEVDESRTALFTDVNPAAIVDARHLDLVAGVHHSLIELGVTVDVMNGCTREDDNLFSYRRHSVTGRGGIAVVLSKVES